MMIFGKAGSKRTVFFVVLIGLIIIGAFLFYVWRETQDVDKNGGETVISQKAVGGYEVNGNIIKNEKYGLTLEAPKGWNIKNYDEGGVGMFSPEIDVNNFMKSAREKGSCLAGVEITDTVGVRDGSDTMADYVRLLIEDNKKSKEDGYEIIKVDNREALEKISLKNGKISYVEVQIPIKNIIYSLNTSIVYKDECVGYFENILKTIKIDN